MHALSHSFCWHINCSDGPNDGRKSFRNTVVLSILLKWKNNVHRFTVIMHSRQSCGDWMIKNKKATLMRNLFAKYKIKRNGGRDYECFHLSEMMDTYDARIKKKDENLIHVLVSPGEPNDTGCLSWHKCKPKHETKIKHNKPRLLLVPEFLNHCAFVSSHASLMNELSVKQGPEYHHALQLLCVALLTPSPNQFQWVVRHMTNDFDWQK